MLWPAKLWEGPPGLICSTLGSESGKLGTFDNFGLTEAREAIM